VTSSRRESRAFSRVRARRRNAPAEPASAPRTFRFPRRDETPRGEQTRSSPLCPPPLAAISGAVLCSRWNTTPLGSRPRDAIAPHLRRPGERAGVSRFESDRSIVDHCYFPPCGENSPVCLSTFARFSRELACGRKFDAFSLELIVSRARTYVRAQKPSEILVIRTSGLARFEINRD